MNKMIHISIYGMLHTKKILKVYSPIPFCEEFKEANSYKPVNSIMRSICGLGSTIAYPHMIYIAYK